MKSDGNFCTLKDLNITHNLHSLEDMHKTPTFQVKEVHKTILSAQKELESSQLQAHHQKGTISAFFDNKQDLAN